MPDILTMHATLQPDKVALIEGDRKLTYAEYNELANRATHAFAELGVGAGDRVAIQAFNSMAGSPVSAGTRKLGAIGVPINFRLRSSELAYVINDSGARILCAGPEFVEHVEAARQDLAGSPSLISLGGETPAGWLSFEALLAAASPQEPGEPPLDGLGASMIYTSGTTGHPKGAYRPRGVSTEKVMEWMTLFDLRGDDVHLMAGPGYHSAVAAFSGLAIGLGGTLVIMPRFDATDALRLIQDHRVTNTFMAPTLLHRIMDLPSDVRRSYDVSSMRAIILGGAPCPFSLKERAIEYFGQCLYEFYGATETGIDLILRPEEQLRKPGSAGRPTPGHEILLLDDDGDPVPDGEPGQLYVRSDMLASYYNRPDATQKAMRDGYFSVGDVAYRDPDGYYYICDRKIDMVISGGVNIYPAEVEACLHAHPAVGDVAVIGVPDDEWGESVKAVVALHPGDQATEEELIGWCRGRIADYKRPRSVDFVAELPRDPAGKLLKRKIREPYWAEAGRHI